MVIWFVTMRNLFLLHFSPQFTIHEGDLAGQRRDLLLKDAAHVVQEPGGAGEQRGCVIHMVKEVLRIRAALFRDHDGRLAQGHGKDLVKPQR